MSNTASHGAKLVADIYAGKVSEGYTNLLTLPNYFSNVLLDSNTNELHIPIRGTENWKDILTDADCDTISIPGGKVHHGAYKQYVELQDYFIAVAKQFRIQHSHEADFKYKINVYGHSMGTWLGILLFEELHFIFPTTASINLYLYAPPNFCDKNYINYIHNLKNTDSTIHSFACDLDLVRLGPIGLHQIVSINELCFKDVEPLDELGHHHIDNFIKTLTDLGL